MHARVRRSYRTAAVLCAAFGLWLSLVGTAAAYDDIVVSLQKISDTEGSFDGILDPGDYFGTSVASLGDLDGDGIVDLAVGAFDDDGGIDRGAVWILFLAANGTVQSHQKISDIAGGFMGTLQDGDHLGYPVVTLGDLDDDGTVDLAVSAPLDDDGGVDRGAIWILFLHPDGTVKTEQKISSSVGGFGGLLDDGDVFGHRLAALGDLDGDGIEDLATSSWADDDGGFNRGAVWILFLNADGTVKAHQKISDTEGGFAPALHDTDHFGYPATVGDLDGDGVVDLATTELPDWGSANQHPGKIWVLFLNTDGTVKAHQEISSAAGGFAGALDLGDNFGDGKICLGDLDGDGVQDLAVGAGFDDDGGSGRGATWILFLNANGTVKTEQKISDTEGGFEGVLDDLDLFGTATAYVADPDGDAVMERMLVLGAHGDDDGGTDKGAVWLVFLEDRGPPAIPATGTTGLVLFGLALAALLAGQRLRRQG